LNRVKRMMFRSAMLTWRAYAKLFLDLRVWGLEKIPAGPKIYMQNHITSNDHYIVWPLLPECIHAVVGPGYNIRPLAWVLDRIEQINAMPEHRATAVDKAVAYLQKGESVYMAPEGDLQELFKLGRFYPGVAKMYRRCRVPIIPIALVAPKRHLRDYKSLEIEVDGRVYPALFQPRGTYCVFFGDAIYPEVRDDVDEREDNERIMAELKARMAVMMEEVRTEKFWFE